MGISTGGAALLVPLLLLLLPPPAAPSSFTYNFTSPSDTPPPGISFQGDAFYNKAIRLTRDERLGPITSSTGRAFYSRAVPLADPVTRRPASFSTAFAFSIAAPDPAAASGDGLAFFLSPFPSSLPASSAGGLLGLFNSTSPRAAPLVAVEFDTYRKAGEFDDGDIIEVDDVMGGDYDELSDEFVVESGPRRFRYAELAAATRNFAEERKLGQGRTCGAHRYCIEPLTCGAHCYCSCENHPGRKNERI
ncbi:unnamed protein product [Urochloa humidicola]